MKKKGFTLIELLAVIVILAVIALIAVPIVLNLIEQSRKKAAVSSALGYVRSVNYKIANEALLGNVVSEDEEYIIGENELDIKADNIDNITGSYFLADGRVKWAGLCVGKYSVEYNDGYAEISTGFCEAGEEYAFVEPEGIRLSEACKTDADSVYSNNTNFKIKKVEDLACLSNLVNSGKNFSDKNIYLLADIDISNSNSYDTPSTDIYGDINGNGTIEGLLAELTTGAGFKPIGNNNNKFSGTFLGYAHTISNLMIDRPISYVGLFGYNAGTISGFKMTGASIKGKEYVGAVVGRNDNILKNVEVKADVLGTNDYIGGVVGDNNKVSTTDAIFSGSVKGKSSVGGIAGSGWSNVTTKGVVYDSIIESTDTSSSKRVGKVVGGVYSSIETVARNSNTTIIYSGSRQNSVDGVEFSKLSLPNLDDTIDTYIGGDNDSDGYYFDYDSEGNITLYSASRRPLNSEEINGTIYTKNLKGRGTEDNPYLIRNEKDWRLASATVTQGKYYSLTKNIDFTDKDFYALGTGTNKFNGHFNGDMNTISNISIEGYKNVAIFGYNTGIVEALRLNNITLSASGENTGAIASVNEGTVNGIVGRNISVTSTPTGNTYVGGIVGKNTNIVKNIDNKGTIVAAGDYVGGVVGDNNKVSTTDAIFSGSVKGKSSVGGIAGSGWSNVTTKGAVYDSTIESTDTSSSKRVGKVVGGVYSSIETVARNSNVTLTYQGTRQYGTDGVEFSKLSLPNLDDTIDTYIGGDNDSDGYYFDYALDGTVILYSAAEDKDPIKNTLAGEGTESNPYKISSTADWKVASAFSNQNKYFELTTDLDFANLNLYTLGTIANKFTGNFNGNMNTISNINIEGYKEVAIFGYNTGKVEALKLNNITLKANGINTGSIAGTNEGTVTGIIGRNINITSTADGSTYVGGIVGKNTNIVKNIDNKGTIVAAGTYVGGVVGDNNKTVADAIFSGNVKGKDHVGGIAGLGWSNVTTKGAVYDSIVEATDTSSSKRVGKVIGGVYSSTVTSARNSNVTLTYQGSRQYGTDGVGFSKLSLPNLDDTIDTYIGGDNDSDGYYFDYATDGTITLYSAAEDKDPIKNTLSGSGTQASPYVINDYNDWKMASATVTQGKYYSLNSSIDFAGKNFYPLGTGTNKFNGHFNGNMNTISNISIDGYKDVAIFGYNTGEIEALRLNNITLQASGENIGSIASVNEGTVNGIVGRNISITSTPTSGYMYVGGLVGNNKNIVKNADIRGNITAQSDYVGGVIGDNNKTVTDIAFSGSVTGKSGVGGLAGLAWSNVTTKGFVYNSTITSPSTSSSKRVGKSIGGVYGSTVAAKNYNTTLNYTGSRESYSDGTEITEMTVSNIASVVDTTDYNSDGFYFTITNGDLELLRS